MFLFAAGVGIILLALILSGRERQNYVDFQDRALHREGVTNLADLSLVMADLTDQLNETADRITSDLDKRASELRELIYAAKQLASASIASDLNAANTGAAITDTASMPATGTAFKEDEAAPEHADRPEEERWPKKVPTAWQEKERAVRELAEQGADVLAIARQLNIGKGEVQLILDLDKTRAR